MATAEQIKIGEETYTARRLTVGDIREINAEIEAAKGRDVIDMMFEDGLPSAALYRSLSIGPADIDNLEPEDVRQLMEAVAKANPTYAAMEKNLAAKLVQLLNNSTAPSPA